MYKREHAHQDTLNVLLDKHHDDISQILEVIEAKAQQGKCSAVFTDNPNNCSKEFISELSEKVEELEYILKDMNYVVNYRHEDIHLGFGKGFIIYLYMYVLW